MTLLQPTQAMADTEDSPLSDLSELSEAESLSTDEEIESGKLRGPLDNWIKTAVSPPAKRKRPASPPHEFVLEDNPAIAVCTDALSVFPS